MDSDLAAALVLRRNHPPYDFPALLAEGQRRLSDGRFAEADESFQRMLSVDTRHGYRDDAAFYRAIVSQESPGSCGTTMRTLLAGYF